MLSLVILLFALSIGWSSALADSSHQLLKDDPQKANNNVERTRLDRSYQIGAQPNSLHYYAQAAAPSLIYPASVPATALYIPSQVSVYSVTSADLSNKYGAPSKYGPKTSYSIEQSVDLTSSSTLPPPSLPSTYGPPKSIDNTYKRPSNYYHRYRYKPYSTRSRPSNSRPHSYTHYHKGHLHTHYLPPSKSYSAPATVQPTYSPPTSTESGTYNHHAYPSASSVRFPEASSHSELTQAIIGEHGVIRNSFDNSVPFKIPAPKPNQFEVRDILKNADLHFVDVQESYPAQFQVPVKPYTEIDFYAQPVYQAPSSNFASSELYDKRYQAVPTNYQNNDLEQDVGSSDTVKVPVAVFKGVVPSMFPMALKRSDDAGLQSKPLTFTPSKTTSDWIPMTGSLNHYGDDFFAGLQKKSGKDLELPQRDFPAQSEVVTTEKSLKKVGDIISGKIPREHNPFSHLPSRPNNNVVGDTSNLVVSSVIKFSR